MSPLKMGSKQVKAVSAEELTSRSAALEQAVETGGRELDPAAVAAARAVVDKIGERISKAGNHTVVALAGATGSGKSSLFNALVGAEVAVVGARRPTTSRPVAAVWGDEDATELLDWLSVSQRHHVAPGATDATRVTPWTLDGLVLLDLPDFDSRVVAHREESERVLELVDVFVWVTDPQKYADARLHDDYLRVLATHDAVTVVVLNQSDRLIGDATGQIRKDLTRLAADDGIPGLQVITTSATTGVGVDDLRMRLATAVAAQNAAQHRLLADVSASAATLRGGVAPTEPTLPESVDAELVDALSRAAGIPTVVAAVERDYRNQAWGRTGWPFTRWVRALRPDPMKRLRLNTRDAVEEKLAVTAGDVRTVLGRSSLPPPTPAARSAVELATRRVGDQAAEGLPNRWAEAVADAATPPGPELADALDQAVVGTSLKMRAPLWWRLFGAAQLVLALVAVLGFGWLAVLVVMGWLALPDIDTPRLGPLPYPLLMLVGGLLVGLGLAALARALGRRGARRRGRQIRRRLTDKVAEVAGERIVGPVRAVLERHRRTRESLDRAEQFSRR
ncbi:YfjP family GTPase [Phycicoccus sp. Soil803]|uniref:YfjP family GTPase n=1 Tax=Phycicoccus sp. Soil803 TaxID=1736415 RepID=UPI000710ECBE|nr:YfjP family GTPase [Phycicoccus sp. Soil803]KRF24420.1 ABC transporter [Phycicoccus sp. Soil803]